MTKFDIISHRLYQARHGTLARGRLTQALSLRSATGRLGVAIVAVAITLIALPLILSLLPGSIGVEPATSRVPVEPWPTAPPTYISPVAPAAITLRSLPSAIPLPKPEWQEMSHLTVIEFTLSNVVDIQRTADVGLFGDMVTDRLLLKATGEIQLGIDLEQVRDVQINGDTIQFTAPKPEIISVELLPHRSQIFERRQVLFLSNYTGLETEALEMARRQLRAEVAANPSMMKLAEEYGRLQLTEFLRKLGYATVEITFVEGVIRL